MGVFDLAIIDLYTPYVTVISKFYGWYVEKANLHLDEFSLLILKTYLHSKRPCPIEKFTFRHFITLSQKREDIFLAKITCWAFVSKGKKVNRFHASC